jgi:predicted phage terminase large subunit-like protein
VSAATALRVSTIEEFNALPMAMQDQVREQIRMSRIRGDLERSMRHRGVKLFTWQKHLAHILTGVVHDCLAGRGRNVILEAPPRVGKTYLTVTELIPWALRLAEITPGAPFGGALPVMAIGAEGSLTERSSEDAQAHYLAWADLFKSGGRGTKWTKREWKTEPGGRVIARGVRANTTGGGFLLGAADDLLSIGNTGAAAKAQAWDTFRREFLSRRMTGAATVLMAHRVAVDDPSGRWMDLMDRGGVPYEVHTWRMEAEEDEYDHRGKLVRRSGDLLCPQMVGPELVAEAKLDPWFWSTTYQQRPTREGGAVILEEWCGHRYHEDPASLAQILPKVFVVIDPAAKIKERNDPSALGVVGVRADGVVFVLHVEAKRREYPDTKQRAIDLYHQWGANAILVEDTNIGHALVPELRRMGIPAEAVPVAGRGDKVERMSPHLPKWASGHVKLPQSAPWVGEFVAEMTTVPDAPHDDMWDMMSVLLHYLAKGAMPKLKSWSPGFTVI